MEEYKNGSLYLANILAVDFLTLISATILLNWVTHGPTLCDEKNCKYLQTITALT